MSGLELPAFVVGVAGLFSSSVDAFSYFKAAQNADEDVDTVLLKLDVEKTRLLLWANEIGMFSANQQHPRLLDEAVVELISRILKKVTTKLTDSKQLRESYGLTEIVASHGTAVDYLSSNGFEIFRRSSHRFWTRYASKLRANRPPGEGSPLAKTKWAIYEKEKFQTLVNDIKDFVDSLYEFIPIDKETQMHVFKADIESILDLSHLKLVEAATEDTYRAYSEMAGSVIEASENGTVDRRTVEEYVCDSQDLKQEIPPPPNRTPNLNEDLHDLRLELESCTVHAVLTSPCHTLDSTNPCDVLQLGDQASKWGSQFSLGITSNKEHQYALWNQLRNVMGIRAEIQEAFRDHRSEVMAHFVKNQDLQGDNDRHQAFEAFLPLVSISIYCSPCVCQLHTAMDISHRLESKFVRPRIRPDDRIRSSCCLNTDRVAGLRSILDYVHQSEVEEIAVWEMITYYLDQVWVGRRLDSFDYDGQDNYTEHSLNKIIVIGEADYLQPLLGKATGRVPKPGEIWTMTPNFPIGYKHSHNRKFQYRFVEKRRAAGLGKTTPVKQHLLPDSKAATPEAGGLKRTVSSASISSKRRRQSDTLEVENRGDDITKSLVSNPWVRHDKKEA